MMLPPVMFVGVYFFCFFVFFVLGLLGFSIVSFNMPDFF